jgi:hypothetical protein
MKVEMETIELRQILITQPIIKAVKDVYPDMEMSQFKTSKQPAGFGLSRMDRMMEEFEFDELLRTEPIEITPATKNGKLVGIQIDGKMKKLYEIVNGRHRIARAIIEKHTIIPANIL